MAMSNGNAKPSPAALSEEERAERRRQQLAESQRRRRQRLRDEGKAGIKLEISRQAHARLKSLVKRHSPPGSPLTQREMLERLIQLAHAGRIPDELLDGKTPPRRRRG